MKILMVSTEYPPMKGGVGRYTSHLTNALRKLDIDVYVACNKSGKGDFSGLSPTNTLNSEVLLKIVNDLKPEIVHIQFEPGMYGLLIDPKNPKKSGTYIDMFYRKCRTPIVTTFHSGYSLKQWMSQALLIKKTGKTGRFGIPFRFANRFWKYFLNYTSFKDLNKQKLALSASGIVFSNYMSRILNGGKVIYHGSEPYLSTTTITNDEKNHLRSLFSLPADKKIALALGFKTITKGWDIIEKMEIPDGWTIVINSSKSHFNTEDYEFNSTNKNSDNNRIIDLQKDFLDEKEFSLLFYASDAVLLPYKVTAGSGVMFDALSHGIPFIASDLSFFKEFASYGLGITVRRNPLAFSKAIKKLEENYSYYTHNIEKFKQRLKWDYVANEHKSIYSSITG